MSKNPFKISHNPPPCYRKAAKKFGVNFFRDGIVFTYGTTLHFHQGALSPDVIAHEMTHIKQQAAFPGGPEAWWKQYIEDDAFRFEQEKEAYRAQWDYIQKNYTKRTQTHLLRFISKSFARIYALPDFTEEKAMAVIANNQQGDL